MHYDPATQSHHAGIARRVSAKTQLPGLPCALCQPSEVQEKRSVPVFVPESLYLLTELQMSLSRGSVKSYFPIWIFHRTPHHNLK